MPDKIFSYKSIVDQTEVLIGHYPNNLQEVNRDRCIDFENQLVKIMIRQRVTLEIPLKQ